MKAHLVLSACLLVAGSVPSLAIDPIFVPVGPELRPYGAMPCCNDIGAVKMAADGSFVVHWDHDESGVSSSWVRRFAADGSPLSAAIEVPVENSLAYQLNLLSSAPDGSFVLLSTVPAGPVTETLRASVFGPLGQAGPAVDVAVIHPGRANVGHDGQGNFVVLWSDQLRLLAARFDAAGNPLGAVFEVPQALAGYASVQITVAPNGSFTAFYEKRDDPEIDGRLHQRRYDAAGQALGAEEPVVPQVVHFDSQAAMAADSFAAAVFAVGHGTRGHLFDSQGVQGPAFTIWDDPNDIAWVPLVASLAGGDFAAAATVAVDNLQESLFLVRIGRDGLPVGPQLVVTSELQDTGAGAMASSGDRIVVFAARGSEEPYLQIYEAPLFADSFETGDFSAWTP